MEMLGIPAWPLIQEEHVVRSEISMIKQHRMITQFLTSYCMAGMGRYKPVRQALDLLLHQDALEAVLQKTPAALESHGIAGVSNRSCPSDAVQVTDISTGLVDHQHSSSALTQLCLVR